MEMFPSPFSLGTSSAKVTDIIPATVQFDPENADKIHVGCHIGGVYYSNKNQSSLKDSNFVTVVFNNKTEEVHVIHRKPEFLGPCFDYDQEPAKTQEPPATDRTTLTNAFGSARRRRLLKESERNAEHRAAVVEATAITKAMHGQKRLKRDNMDAEKLDEGAEKVDERTRLLPSFSTLASSTPDIYPLDKLIPSRIAEALNEESERLATAPVSMYQTWAQQAVYQKCVLDRILQLSSLSVSGDQDKTLNNRFKLALCLAYLSHTLALYSLSSHDIQRKNPLPDTPPVVAKHLLDEFTVLVNRGDSSRLKLRTMTPMLRDRLIYHMLAVLLHCDNFKTILDDLTVDFRMGSDKLRRYFVYMGCRISKEEVKIGQDQVTRLKASLHAPVRFPESRVYKTHRESVLD